MTFSASPLHQHTTQRRRNHRASSAILSPSPLSLYVTQRRRERVLSHIPYHHAREVRIFARKNFSQQITAKTLKNSLSVVVNTLTLCSYNFFLPGSNPAQYPFFFPSVFLFFVSFSFSFLFCLLICFVVVVFKIYTS